MPFIEENDLLALHKDIEKAQTSNEKLLDQIKYKNKDLRSIKIQRNVLLGVAVLLVLGFLAFTSFWAGFNSKKTVEDKTNAPGATENLQAMKTQITELKAQNDALSQVKELYLAEALLEKEKVYAVQVMAFAKSKTALVSEGLLTSRFLKTHPFYGYSLGVFETLAEAQEFRKQLVAMGFSDAFVASYQNGKRIRIEEPYSF